MDKLKKYLLPSLTLAAFLICLVAVLVLIFAGGANPLFLATTGVVGALAGYRVVRKDYPAVWAPLVGLA
jgi:hypothetical protein